MPAPAPAPESGGPVDEGRAPGLDRRATAVAVGVPLLAGALVLGADALWDDRLATVIATHWGASGEPDGFGSRTGFVLGITAMTVLVPLAIGAAACSAAVWTALRRSLLGCAVWTAVFLAWVAVGSLAVQLDGAPGRIGPVQMVAPALAGLAAGVLAARAPRELRVPVPAVGRPPAHLPRSGTTSVEPHPVGFGGRVAVDEGDLLVRWLGAQALRVDLAEVDRAEVVTVSGWDFGGWGLRMAVGERRYAFVGRGGPAVELHRADGTRWAVTTPRAEEVAGAVNTAADRSR